MFRHDDISLYQFDKEEGLVRLCPSLVQGPAGRPVAVSVGILLSELVVNIQDDDAGRVNDRLGPIDRHVAYDGHAQIRMRFQAERQDGDADEEHRHQSNNL